MAMSPFGFRKESEDMESEMVKMESRGKLGNDEKVKFVGPSKNVRWREKACVSRDICKLHKNHYFPHFLILYHFTLSTKQALYLALKYVNCLLLIGLDSF